MVILDFTTDSTRKAWNNFYCCTYAYFYSNIYKGEGSPDGRLYVEGIFWASWRGRLIYDTPTPGFSSKAVFESEKDATLFLLRWS